MVHCVLLLLHESCATVFSTITLAFLGQSLRFLYRWKQLWILNSSHTCLIAYFSIYYYDYYYIFSSPRLAEYRLIPCAVIADISTVVCAAVSDPWRRYTRVRQVKLSGEKIHRPGSSPGSALPSPAYCFASVIVWTEKYKCYYIWPLYLFYFDSETALAACVLRATTEKGRQFFFEEKVHPVTWLAGLLRWRRHCQWPARAIPASGRREVPVISRLKTATRAPAGVEC